MSQVITPLKIVEKTWGFEEWLHNDQDYCIKYLNIEPGWKCSKHYHPRKKETFVVVQGRCIVSVNDELYDAKMGDQFEIAPKTIHWFGVPDGENTCTLLEVSTFHDDADVVRLAESGKFMDEKV